MMTQPAPNPIAPAPPRNTPVVLSPAMATLAVVGVVLGALGIIGVVLAGMASMVPPANLLNRGIPVAPTPAGLNWMSIILGGITAILLLLGSVDCLLRRPSGRRWVRVSAFCSLVSWALGLLVAVSIGFPTTSNVNMPGAGLTLEQGQLVGFLVLSTLLNWSWAGAVLWITRPSAALAESAALQNIGLGHHDDELSPIAQTRAALEAAAVPGQLQYRSRTDAKLDSSSADKLVAPPSLARVIYIVALVWGALSAMETAYIWYVEYGYYSSSPRQNIFAAMSLPQAISLGTEPLFACAMLGVCVGAVLALARSNAGRFVIFGSLSALVLIGAVVLCLVAIPQALERPSFFVGGNPLMYSSPPWFIIFSSVSEFFRKLTFPIICFAALRRRPRRV